MFSRIITRSTPPGTSSPTHFDAHPSPQACPPNLATPFTLGRSLLPQTSSLSLSLATASYKVTPSHMTSCLKPQALQLQRQLRTAGTHLPVGTLGGGRGP
jgi:hypothetical protein